MKGRAMMISGGRKAKGKVFVVMKMQPGRRIENRG